MYMLPSFSAQQQNAAQERVRINDADTLTTRADICGTVSIPASEFHFMVKSGQSNNYESVVYLLRQNIHTCIPKFPKAVVHMVVIGQ